MNLLLLSLIVYIAYGADNNCVFTNSDGKVFNLTSIESQLTIGWLPSQTQFFLLTPCANGIICKEESNNYYMAVQSGTHQNNDCEAYLAKEAVNDKPVVFDRRNGGTIVFNYKGAWLQGHPACQDTGINTTITYQCNSQNGDKLTPLTIMQTNPCQVNLIENTSLACLY